ncbi:MAG TPA: 16S rRNA (guanine(527)-N(7))-methyltransferase RsmG [Candidatus Babeliales bacterium]|nr:16S rRNA (guanine(527)-N(7))-methyltransferase RsmG [Candidatus Babeliales bacterium]
MNKQHLESHIIDNQLSEIISKYTLTTAQTDKFKRYLNLLIEWNTKFNLTAITEPSSVIRYHFDDSLALTQHIDCTSINSLADIGTGAGFPAIPLKIIHPHLTTILIEVNNKKRSFLERIIKELELENVIIYPYDWRTFLRSTTYTIDYFLARASLQPEELIRLFKPTSTYKNRSLIYWASQQWLPNKIEVSFIEKEVSYTLDAIQRKLVFFKQKNSSQGTSW